MGDIAAVYSVYDKKLTEKYADRQDNLTLAAQVIRNGDSFDENTTIYIDGFDSFSGSTAEFFKSACG